MNKKIQSVVLAGVMSVSSIASTGAIFANEMEVSTVSNQVSKNDCELEVGSGNGNSSDKPAIVKVYTIKGLEHVLNEIVKTHKKSIGISNKTENAGVIEYKVDVIDEHNSYHVILKVENNNNNTQIINILDEIMKRLSVDETIKDIVDMEVTGADGSEAKPYAVRVNTLAGLDKLSKHINNNYSAYYRLKDVERENAWDIRYRICVVSGDKTTHFNVIVDDQKTDVVTALHSMPIDVTSTTPETTTGPTVIPNQPTTPSVEDVKLEGGTGGSNTPYTLKVNSKEGLDKVLGWLNNKFINMSYDREVDVIVDTTTNTTTYKINVFGKNTLVTYVNIKVDSNKQELIDVLKAIKIVLPPIESGDGTPDAPAKVTIDNEESLGAILDDLKSNDMAISEVEIPKQEVNGYLEYKLKVTKKSKIRSKDVFYVVIKVKSSNKEVIDKINKDVVPNNSSTGGSSSSGGSSSVTPDTSNKVELKELAGQTRYETAIKVSQERFKDGKANAVVLVGKDAIVDGLAAAPLANSKNAPILFADTNTITSETKQEISRVLGNNLSGKTIYIVGGEAKISKSVESMLAQMGVKVERLAGEDRFETSLEVAKHLNGNSNMAFVVGGNGEADAMSISSKAAELKAPIVVVNKGNLTEEAKALLKDKEIHIIGGTGVVSEKVETELDKLDSNKDSDRVAGLDRKETNAKVISTFYKSEDISELFIAKDGYVGGNDKLVDALAVAPLAGTKSAPIILTTDALNKSQQENISGLNKVSKVVQVGYGISKDVVNSIVELLKK